MGRGKQVGFPIYQALGDRGRADTLWVIDAYETALRGRGKAPATVDVYLHTARALLGSHDVATVSAAELEAWLAGLGVSNATRGQYLVRLRQLFRWAVREGLRADDPTDLIDAPRVPVRQPRPIPQRYLQALWIACDTRERAWVALGAFCGLRASEVAAVAVEDVQGGWLRVTGKGGRVRSVPLRDEVYGALEAVGWPASGRFFPRLTGRRVSVLVGQRLREVGCPALYTMHSLRHRFGTSLFAECHDLRVVQQLMGHSSLQTTAVYLQVEDAQARRAVASMPGLVA